MALVTTPCWQVAPLPLLPLVARLLLRPSGPRPPELSRHSYYKTLLVHAKGDYNTGIAT